MKAEQLTIDSKCATIVAHLNNVITNQVLLGKLKLLDEVELNRVSVLVRRIEQKGGSIQHCLKYLELVYL